MDEITLLAEADRRARAYTALVGSRPAFPPADAIAALQSLQRPLPADGEAASDVLALLDELGSAAATASSGGRYFGFVIGGALPAAAAAERLALAWDQCASSAINSPAAAAIEDAAAALVLEALDLPRSSAVGFGTSATACGLSCLTAARRFLLARLGWDFDRRGVEGAPKIRVVVPARAHVTVIKALRILGFGTDHIVYAPCDDNGRVVVTELPMLDNLTILCLQAGEVNTGSFDDFSSIIPRARAAGAWVHVDGAFGLWARASAAHRHLAEGVEEADSWTTDGHKWLNVPYDSAMAICRSREALAGAMNSDAHYATADPMAQKNLTLEFSRRLRGVSIWAALRSLGRSGLEAMIDRHVAQAKRVGAAMRDFGLFVLNEVAINQVLVRASDDAETQRILDAVQSEGEVWFGGSRWHDRPVFRISISSWRTSDSDIDRLIAAVARAVRPEG